MKTTNEKILEAGLELWPEITKQAVGDKVGVSRQAVSLRFPGDILKDAIARYAVKIDNSRVIVQLLALNHVSVAGMSDEDKSRHFAAI